MYYKVESRDYLLRSRERLDQGTPESLFYAAFELRCGIEARMREYLEVQKLVSIKVKKGWQVAVLGKELDKLFKTGDKIAEFTFFDNKRQNITTLYYTPVSSKLKKMAEKLGDLLHAARKYRKPDDPWWSETRTFLEEVYEELRKANIGNLLGVPLIKRRTGQLEIYSEVNGRSERLYIHMKKIGIGGKGIVKVNYLDSIPE